MDTESNWLEDTANVFIIVTAIVSLSGLYKVHKLLDTALVELEKEPSEER